MYVQQNSDNVLVFTNMTCSYMLTIRLNVLAIH